MILIDTALQARERERRPIQVGLIGAGFAAKGFALQLLGGLPGLRLACISNRTLETACLAYRDAGVNDLVQVDSPEQLETAVKAGRRAVTADYSAITACPAIDCVVEATGEVEFGLHVCLEAFANRKHVVLINNELDATLGPILSVRARQAGVCYALADGDQPAVIMNLYRHVKSMGFVPVMAGNIKSLLDHRRTPATQAEFARKAWQRPKFITSFADGTKISQEMASVANATGFPVQARSMAGPRCAHVDEAWKRFDLDRLMSTGLTDYVLGAEPSFGVFVLAHCESQPLKKRWMKVYKMGDGPIYTFYTPHHLSPLEAPASVARAVLYGDNPVRPLGGPVCEVVTVAKQDLRAGERLDGIGGYHAYGAIDNAATTMCEDLLPMGLAEGCVLKRDLAMGAAISFADVELPKGRLSDRLWAEQAGYFGLRHTRSAA